MSFDNVVQVIGLVAAIANVAVAAYIYRSTNQLSGRAPWSLMVFALVFLLRAISRFTVVFHLSPIATALADLCVVIALVVFMFTITDLVRGLASDRSQAQLKTIDYDDALTHVELSIRAQRDSDLVAVRGSLCVLEQELSGEQQVRVTRAIAVLDRYQLNPQS